MVDQRRTSEYRKGRALLAGIAEGVNDETTDQDIQALLQALDTHKSGMDHDDRYYTETETNGLLSYKVDKTLTLTAGDGLTGGGGLSLDRTFAVGQGFGLTVTADAVEVNLTSNFTWTGGHTFSGSLTTGSIMPALSDVYDLGDYTKPWRKIWGSELSAVVFSQYEQVLLGGWLTISKGEGKLATAVTSTDTQINLGAGTFANGDILVFRSISSNGTPQVEYMMVGTLVSGTTYNITRNLDGTGANDWPDGSVFANWGQVGSGRVELNAYDTPRISIYSHGAAIADFREQLRFGDLNGGWGYGTSIFGGVFGAYEVGKANITIDPTNGIRIRNYDQDVIKLTGTTASFEQFITLGANGGIRQGSGTWVTPPTAGNTFTGTALWAESSIMNVGGWNAGVKQWWGGSDGKFYANGGLIKMGDQGLVLNSGINDGDGRITFQTSGVDTVKVEQVNQLSTFTFVSGLTFKALYAQDAFPSAMGYNYAGPQLGFEILNPSQTVVSNLWLSEQEIFLGHPPNPGILFNKQNGDILYTANGGHTFVGPVTVRTLSSQGISNSDYNVLECRAFGFSSIPTWTSSFIGQYGPTASGNIMDAIPRANMGVVGFQNNGGGVIYTNSGVPLIFATSAVERMRITGDGNVNISTAAAILTVGVGVNSGTVSAGIFTDRTKFYDGDALSEITAIKGVDGEIDHATLPAFARVKREVIIEPAIEAKDGVKTKPAVIEIQEERDLGAMISMLTVAVQQLDEKLNELIIKQEGIA